MPDIYRNKLHTITHYMKVKKRCKYYFDEYNIDKRITYYCDICNVTLHPECFGI